MVYPPLEGVFTGLTTRRSLFDVAAISSALIVIYMKAEYPYIYTVPLHIIYVQCTPYYKKVSVRPKKSDASRVKPPEKQRDRITTTKRNQHTLLH